MRKLIYTERYVRAVKESPDTASISPEYRGEQARRKRVTKTGDAFCRWRSPAALYRTILDGHNTKSPQIGFDGS